MIWLPYESEEINSALLIMHSICSKLANFEHQKHFGEQEGNSRTVCINFYHFHFNISKWFKISLFYTLLDQRCLLDRLYSLVIYTAFSQLYSSQM